MKGIITLWSGAIVDIPFGWKLCDGNNGTPDLRDKFLVGAGSTYSPDDSGGAATHLHPCDFGYHYHTLGSGIEIINSDPTGDWADHDSSTKVDGNTDAASSLPPYYALCYIMHI